MSDIILSASKIKTAQSCSWKYWCKYHLNLPEHGNDGARRGTICHNVFEHLSKQKTKSQYNKIVNSQNPFSVKVIKEIIISQAKELGVDDEENLESIKDMILNGLSFNFYGEELGIPSKSFSELDFNINQNGYHIRGFIDQLFLYEDRKIALIRDYKTSKKMFNGKEVEDNLQDYMYCLAVKNLFPEYEDIFSEFLFLKFIDRRQIELFSEERKGAIKMAKLSDDDLAGFEMQLAEIQSYLENFDEQTAVSNFAYDKGFPSDDSFSGKLECGFAKEKGQLKKDGTLMWSCPFKFDFEYVLIFDSNGDFSTSVFLENFDESMVPEGGRYEKMKYNGCPRHNT
jgi:hypothetical protein